MTLPKTRLKATSGHRAIALVELTVAIGALTAASIVILQLFVGAERWANKARDLDMACFEAQSVIELYRLYGAPTDPSGAWQRPARRVGGSQWEIDYDSGWHPADGPADKGFTLSLTVTHVPDGPDRLDVAVIRHAGAAEGETVFEVSGMATPFVGRAGPGAP